MNRGSTRRTALVRLAAGCSLPALAACGGGGDAAAPAPAPPPAPTPLLRLKAALAQPALALSSLPVTVTQAAGNSRLSTFGDDARFAPPLDGLASLAATPLLWGHRRELWELQSGARIAGKVVYPATRSHPAATTGSGGVCGLHFLFDGSEFEVLCAGTDAQITLLADGQYMAPGLIRHTLEGGVPGQLLALPEVSVHMRFGSAALRRISLYAVSSRGPCAIVTPPGSQLQAWDRSSEASFAAMADSYGGALGRHWRGGPFWEAAARLGIPHLDLDAVGGTGYAPNNTNAETRNPGNAFAARLPSNVNGRPDLFLSAGGINDNHDHEALPLYASAAAARAGFVAGVQTHFARLREALPDAVLAACGPWRPRADAVRDAVEQDKAALIAAALAAAGGPWIFLDNLAGTWRNSAGARGGSGSPWQTGTGHSGRPAGDGNGDLYLEADGVHPNSAGCAYLGRRLADDLRAALLAL